MAERRNRGERPGSSWAEVGGSITGPGKQEVIGFLPVCPSVCPAGATEAPELHLCLPDIKPPDQSVFDPKDVPDHLIG